MENRRKLGKEDSLVHWWHDTCAARHLGLHAIAPTTWGMSPWRAIVVSKWKSRFRSGQKERPCDSETKYNAFLIPVFHSLHLIQKGHKRERATYRVWSLSTYLQVEQTSRQKKQTKKTWKKIKEKKQQQRVHRVLLHTGSLWSLSVLEGGHAVKLQWTTASTTFAVGQLLVHNYSSEEHVPGNGDRMRVSLMVICLYYMLLSVTGPSVTKALCPC